MWPFKKKNYRHLLTEEMFRRLSIDLDQTFEYLARKNDGSSYADITRNIPTKALYRIKPEILFYTGLWLHCEIGRAFKINQKLVKLLNDKNF